MSKNIFDKDTVMTSPSTKPSLDSLSKLHGRTQKRLLVWALATSCATTSFALTACGSSSTPAAKTPEQEPATDEEREALILKVQMLIEDGDAASAIPLLKEAIAASPYDPQLALLMGVAHESDGSADEAIVEYRRALKIQPKLLDASQNLSGLLIDINRPQEALVVADAGLAFVPEDKALLINRAYALDIMDDPATIPAFEKALELAPKDGVLRLYFVQRLILSEQKERAFQELAAIPLDGKSVPVIEVVALYSRLDDFQGCVKAIDIAVETEQSVELYVHRANCKERLKDAAGAEADYRLAVATDANSADAHYWLARFLTNAGQGQEARTHLEKAAELGPNTPAGKAAQRVLDKSAASAAAAE
ncbi:MAG: tetratricopeptide repeat protein [Polyangiaceae bacterium]|nr:tetratricopeptide repeat protein [Polyangiaceae bacterium]